MQSSFADAVLRSWNVNAFLVYLLGALAFLYLRGWIRLRGPGAQLSSFLGGLLLIFVALESPLDAFGRFFLWVHMTQHILLMMAAPLLIVAARPRPFLLKGLPGFWVREGIGPWLRLPLVDHIGRRLATPAVAWGLFAFCFIFWHVPRFYELALTSQGWHDVQHACFFWSGVLFWWPLLNQPRGSHKWFAIPYLLLADLLNTAFSAFLIFSGNLLYPAYSATRLTELSALDDQAIAGLVMWVPASFFFLIPAVMLVLRQFMPPRPSLAPARRIRRRGFASTRLLDLRRYGRPIMLAGAVAVAVCGFFGSESSTARTAGTLPWIQWRAASVAALLVFGNLFCMTCPFTLARDLARRVHAPRLRWPEYLSTKWLAAALLLGYLWAYESFHLWDRAAATASVIVCYFVAAVSIDVLFRGASFCKYVCPIGQFNFVVSTISPFQVSTRDPKICTSCRTHDCIRGNARSRGCELMLFQPAKAGNMDCTACLDCVTACPSENVSLIAERRSTTLAAGIDGRLDVLALVAIVVFGAFVNAAGMTAPLARFVAPGRFALIVLAGAVAAPLVAICVCAAGDRLLTGIKPGRKSIASCIFALIPLGVSMWAAHLFSHVAPAAMSTASVRQSQIVMLDAGVLMTLYAIWRTARWRAISWAMLSLALYGLGAWIVFQPMQMIGMAM